MKRFRWQLRALIVLAVIGFVGFAYNRAIASLTTENRRVIPVLAEVGWYLVPAALVTVLYLVYLLARYARRDIRARSRGYKTAYWVLSLLAHTVAAAGVAVLVLAAHPDFPLGPVLVEQRPSPAGDQVAYLYRGGVLCAYTVYVRRAGDAELRKVDTIPRDRCDETVHLSWREGGHLAVVDADGAPLVPQTWDLTLWRH